MSQPSNQDGQTTCPECAGSGKQHIKGNMDKDWREIKCLHCSGRGTVPSEAHLHTQECYSGFAECSPHQDGQSEPADSLEQEIPRLLFKSGAIWSVDDPKGDLEDELLALIRRREIALLEKMKREWGYGDTGMDWEEWINAELKRLKEGEKD